MLRSYLKSSLGPLAVTELAPDGPPAIRIDSELLAAAHIMPGEKVRVVPHGAGRAFEGYVMPARRASGTVAIGGASALGILAGEKVTVATECLLVDREALAHEPRLVQVDEHNRIPPPA